MSARRQFSHRLALAGLAAVLLDAGGARSARAEQEFDYFERHIRPVLIERCYECHSAASAKLKGGLRLDTRDALRHGGDSGRPAVVPGDAASSLLIEAIRYTNPKLQMPPQHRLRDEQVAAFVTWINSGAPDPRAAQGTADQHETRHGTLDAKEHWAFRPPQPVPVPAVRKTDWPRTPIDFFILARLESSGFNPSAPADKRTLIRRATYDLTGLPPTPEEVASFERDSSSNAFPKVVDRLLASSRYGERWGRHWLDVARYADTKGYVYDREEKRFVHAHAYRDWVIHALNADVPYDHFLAQQIAADQLPAVESPRFASLQPEPAAMGFLTVGRRFLGVRHDIIDDRIDVLTRGTMGLSVACARCHDHKYDPVPTQDYYSLYGVFNSSTEQLVPLESSRPSDSKASAEYETELRRRQDKLQKTFEQKRDALTDRLRAKVADYLVAVLEADKLPSEEFYVIAGPDDLNPVVVRQWESFLFKRRGAFDPIFTPWQAFAALPASEFAGRAAGIRDSMLARRGAGPGLNTLVHFAFTGPPPASMREVAERYGKLFSDVDRAWRESVALARTNKAAAPRDLDEDREALRQILYAADSPASVPSGSIVDVEWFFDEGGRVELAKLQRAIEQWMIESPGAPPHALTLADRPQPKNARVFLRGNPATPGREVPRQFLEVLTGAPRRPFAHGSGRLELALAIASPDNPLTARVMVNRVWQHHFGAGLVRTPSDFGTRTDSPSHPELLDWLAVNFMTNGWSLKQLHRLILLSATYRQRSDGPSAKAVLAEILDGGQKAAARKAAELDPQNRLLWRMNKSRLDFESMHDSLLAVAGELDEEAGGRPVELFARSPSRRRAVYGYIDRQFVPGTMRFFDFANPDLHIPQRSDTTVPQQALFFMNHSFVLDRARALAARFNASADGERERVARLYQIIFQRRPDKEEMQWAGQFLRYAQAEPPAVPRPETLAWQYGFGRFDAAAGRTEGFTPLPHFTGEAWQGGPNLPDASLGWVQLTAEGGHAGNDPAHAAIRRWVAPRDGDVTVTGTARHEHEPGDGITARVLASRAGLLGSWPLHNKKAEARVERVEVKRGDTVDFLVDFHANLNSDMFKWIPVIKYLDPVPAGEIAEWSGKSGFSGPATAPLSVWAKYAQVLLQANEFLFVD